MIVVSGIVKTWRTPDWLLQGWARTASSFLVVRWLIVDIYLFCPFAQFFAHAHGMLKLGVTARRCYLI